MSAGTAPLVLVVDDSALVTEALAVLLDALGYRSRTAHSVAGAIAAAREEAPAALLLDLTLPDGDGLAVLEALVAPDGPGARPRVAVALTGHDDPEIAARCLAAGCDAVLVKPARAADLARALAPAGA